MCRSVGLQRIESTAATPFCRTGIAMHTNTCQTAKTACTPQMSSAIHSNSLTCFEYQYLNHSGTCPLTPAGTVDKRKALVLWSERKSSGLRILQNKMRNELTPRTISFFCYSAKIILLLRCFWLLAVWLLLQAVGYWLEAI